MATLDMAVLIQGDNIDSKTLISRCLRHRCHTLVLPESNAAMRKDIEKAGLACSTFEESPLSVPAIKGNTAFLCANAGVVRSLEAHFKSCGNHVLRS